MNNTRRNFLALAGSAPLAALAAAAAPAQAAVCYDPNTLPAAQKNRRQALGYVDASADPVKRCGACAFFTPVVPGCGKCALFSGGPVNAGGVCRSFAPRGR